MHAVGRERGGHRRAPRVDFGAASFGGDLDR